MARKTPARRTKASKKAAAGPSRRRPTQERSRRRFESIIEAAAESFARLGFSDTTMEGIAAEAGTSIGSVYQFFRNKRAVFREVALRCVDLSRSSYAELLGPDPLTRPWNEVLERYIDGYRRMFEGNSTMQAVWRNIELYGEFAEEDEAMLREMIDSTAMLFAGWAPTVDADRRRVVATVVVNTIAGTLLALAREPNEALGDQLVAETKLMLVRYLSVYLGEPHEA